jgi:hypothetical protein
MLGFPHHVWQTGVIRVTLCSSFCVVVGPAVCTLLLAIILFCARLLILQGFLVEHAVPVFSAV